jgi:hypothetical protein
LAGLRTLFYVLRIRQIVLDAREIDTVARFWSGLLEWPVTRRSDDWVSIDGEDVCLAIQRADDHRPPAWPDSARPQQVHFDIPVTDIEAAERLVIQLGGVRLAERPDDEPPYRIYADPAGHPFCLEYEPVRSDATTTM